MIEFDVRRGRQVGYEEIGPVVAKWAMLLHTHLSTMGSDAVALFASRAGVRMRLAYERFLWVRGWQPACRVETFWTSRLLAAKAALPESPGPVATFIASEYRDQMIGDVLAGLTRHETRWRGRIPDHDDLGRTAKAFPAVVGAADHPLGRFALEYSGWYRERYGRYLADLIGDARQVAIVDSGWQGTVHSLIEPLLPGKRLLSLLAARALRDDEAPPHLASVVGLLHEGPGYERHRPFSAIVHHRHLLESLFETPGESVEHLTDEGGTVAFPAADANLVPVDPYDPADAHLAGTLTYLEDHGDDAPASTLRAAQEAEESLSRRIMFPTPEDVAVLMTPPRGADFGRELRVPVCVDPEHSDLTRAERLGSALWYQGQIALEFPHDVAHPMHVAAAGGWDPDAYFHGHAPSEVPAREGHATVTIVTRTKDRAVLLRRAAASVAEQTYRHYRWVVVNDGGETGPVERVIRDSAVPPDRITLVSNERSVGMEAASNLGVNAVESDYVAIHDDDDSWDPRFLERMVGFMESPRGADFGGVVCRSVYVSESVEGDAVVVHETRPYNPDMEHLQVAELAMGNTFPPISFLFRRSLWADLGGFDESLPVLGDWDFNLRALLHSDLHVVPDSLANYHHRDVGEDAVFGNSVLSARSKHVEFTASYRNAAIRAAGQEAIGSMMATAYFAQVLRHEARLTRAHIERIARLGGGGGDDSSSFTDDLWIALTSMLASTPKRAAKNPAIKWGSIPDGKAVARMAKGADLASVPKPPDFDEAAYLKAYPDVAHAVERGEFTSGYHHYLVFGRKEGRARPVIS